jgi:hypothetical protein
MQVLKHVPEPGGPRGDGDGGGEIDGEGGGGQPGVAPTLSPHSRRHAGSCHMYWRRGSVQSKPADAS